MSDVSKRISGWVAALMVLPAILLTASSASADGVKIPENALSPESSFVMWLDPSLVTQERMDQTFDQLLAAAPEGEKAEAKQIIADARKKMKDVYPVIDELLKGGLEAVVVAGGLPATKKADEEDGDATDAPDRAKQDSHEDDEDEDDDGQMFIKMKPGSGSPKKVFDAALQRLIGAGLVDKNFLDTEDGQEYAATTYKSLGGGWYAAEGEEFLELPRKGQAADPAPLERALNRHAGAPVRYAWVMDEASRHALDKARMEPGNMFFAGMIGALRNLETASGGIWIGKKPRFVVNMAFKNSSDALTFKTSLDQTVTMVGMFMAMAGADQDDPEAAKKAEQMRAGLALLYLDHDGKNLSKTIDTGVLRSLGEAGISWTQVAGQDEEEDASPEPVPGGSGSK